MTEEYNSIQSIKGLAYLRKRAYVNMGSTDSIDGKMPRAQLQMAQEIVSNSVDEALSGHGDKIEITINEDNSMTVVDHGRGIPRDFIDDKTNTTIKYGSAIKIFTEMGTSGKFDNSAYKVSGGLNGIGAAATCALSKWLTVEAQTEAGQHYFVKIDYDKWVKDNEPAETKDLKFDKSVGTYSKVTFMPDERALASTKWDRNALCHRYEMEAYLLPKVKLQLTDKRDLNDETNEYWQREWYSENGLADYIEVVSEGQKPLTGFKKPILFDDEVKTKNDDTIRVHGALRWTEDVGATTYSFVNGIPTTQGGPHLSGALRAINTEIANYASDKKVIKGSLTPSDIQEGLILILEIQVPERLMQFEGQTKEKFGGADAAPATKQVIGEALTGWLYDHAKAAKNLIEKMNESKEARESLIQARKAAKKAQKQKKDGKNKLFVSEKLTVASPNTKFEDRELIITEGDSACLTADTKVLVPNKATSMTMAELLADYKAGKTNFVLSYGLAKEDISTEIESQEYVSEPIEEVLLTRKNAELVKVTFQNGKSIKCTPDHKFLMADGFYKEAQALKGEESVQGVHSWQKVRSVEKLAERQDVYDLKVANTHNFLLSDAGVFVHNCGSVIQARTPNQACFPLRGKILNVLNENLNRVLKNQEISTITSVLGAGIGPVFEEKDLQYNRVIILTDADDDGMHIRSLCIVLFYKYFKPLIDNGHLFIAEAPLFRISRYEKGKPINEYAFSVEERDEILKRWKKNKIKEKDIIITRFKGLGENNAEDLKKAVIDKNTRHLIQVTDKDVEGANENLQLCMGDNSKKRQEWLEDNLKVTGGFD